MIDYIKKHWFILILIFLVWGTTLWMVHEKPKKVDVVRLHPDTLIVKKDSIKNHVDSIVQNIETKKKVTLKKIHELERQKEKYEQEAKKEKQKRIDTEKEVEKHKNKIKEIVEIKEVVKEKNVYVTDPNLEKEIVHYKQENSYLREQLERSYVANQQLKFEKEELKRTYSKENIEADTIRKRKRFLGLF